MHSNLSTDVQFGVRHPQMNIPRQSRWGSDLHFCIFHTIHKVSSGRYQLIDSHIFYVGLSPTEPPSLPNAVQYWLLQLITVEN
jgi:hypothetical protein